MALKVVVPEVLELGGVHLREGNLEALTYMEEVTTDKKTTIFLLLWQDKHGLKEKIIPSYSFAMVGCLGIGFKTHGGGI